MTATRVLIPVDSFTLEFVVRSVIRVLGRGVELLLLPVRAPTDDVAVVLERLEPLGVEMRLLPTHPGEVVAATLTAAEELRPNVIAVATIGYGRWRFGKCPAQDLLRAGSVPVLVCNPCERQLAALDQPVDSVLVPLDGSTLADEVLPLAAWAAGMHQAELVLAHVQEFHACVEPETLEELGLTPEDREELRTLRFPQRSLDLLAARRDQVLGPVRLQPALGKIADEILGLTGDVDLLVLATNGRSGASSWWLGSVTKRILGAAPVPVLAVRTGREAAPISLAPAHSTQGGT